MQRPWSLAGLIGLLIATGSEGAPMLHATGATVATAGEQADVCVVLASDGQPVAGTQNDLVWDGTCATLAGAEDCRIDPATGKSLHGAVSGREDFRYRGLVLSLSDVNPIPDGPLYCCTFTVEAAPGSCCSVAVVHTGASDPNGNHLVATGGTAQLCAASGPAMPSPTATTIPAPTAAARSDATAMDGGCHISPAGRPQLPGMLPAAALLALAIWRTRRLRRGVARDQIRTDLRRIAGHCRH